MSEKLLYQKPLGFHIAKPNPHKYMCVYNNIQSNSRKSDKHVLEALAFHTDPASPNPRLKALSEITADGGTRMQSAWWHSVLG